MATAVSRQKINLPATDIAADQRIGRRTKWRLDLVLGGIA